MPCRALFLSASAPPPLFTKISLRCALIHENLTSLRFSVSIKFYIFNNNSQEQKSHFLLLHSICRIPTVCAGKVDAARVKQSPEKGKTALLPFSPDLPQGLREKGERARFYNRKAPKHRARREKPPPCRQVFPSNLDDSQRLCARIVRAFFKTQTSYPARTVAKCGPCTVFSIPRPTAGARQSRRRTPRR